MGKTLIIASAQLNPVMGDLAGNIAQMRKVRQRAAAKDADLIVYTELGVSAIRQRTWCSSHLWFVIV